MFLGFFEAKKCMWKMKYIWTTKICDWHIACNQDWISNVKGIEADDMPWIILGPSFLFLLLLYFDGRVLSSDKRQVSINPKTFWFLSKVSSFFEINVWSEAEKRSTLIWKANIWTILSVANTERKKELQHRRSQS